MHYVYVLKSLLTDRLYVGQSGDLKRRLNEHNLGKVWTTKRMLPIRLIFYEAFLSREDALRREKYFKSSKGKSSLRQIIQDSIIV